MYNNSNNQHMYKGEKDCDPSNSSSGGGGGGAEEREGQKRRGGGVGELHSSGGTCVRA